MEAIILQGLNGLTAAMYIWLVAAGLTIAFGVLGVLNLAHGSLYMLGGFFAFTFFHLLGLNFALSIILAIIGVGICGFLMERFFLRPIYGEALEIQLILTFAFILILDNATRYIWGTAFTLPKMPSLLEGRVHIAGGTFAIYNLFIIATGVAVFAIVWLILDKTWWGKSVRAAASDREMANAVGINIRTLFSTAFIFAAMVAAVGGAVSIPVRVITSGIGGTIIVDAFIVLVIGSLGSLKGAFVAALIIGLVSAYCQLYIPGMQMFVPYLVMAIVLTIRPQGIFGEAR